MEKQQFVELLGRFSKSSENEALNIMSLKEYFPYSQVFHALSARATKDHRFLEQKIALQLAAVYAADRIVLKQVMSDEELPVGKSLPPFGDFVIHEISPIVDDGSLDFTPDVVDFTRAEISAPTPDASPEADSSSQDATRARLTDAGALNFQQRAQQLQSEAAALAESQPPAVPLPVEPVSVQPPDSTQVTDAPPFPSAPAILERESEPAIAAVDAVEMNVADQVMSDLDKLNKLKHNFEALFEANKASIILRDAAITVGAAPVEDLNRIQLARQKRIAELVSSLDPEVNGSDSVGELDYGVANKNFLEEINNNRQALEPENQKQIDQLRMIDDFIKTQPGINSREKAENASEDLSTIKTGDFSDNIVSETLVDILVKQGKRDKAIEVLKKLIWKFPQKKAYFAAQIEDLKK